MEYRYKRILLKITGEALNLENAAGSPYEKKAIDQLADNLTRLSKDGIQLGVVIGAGNVWRGKVGTQVGMNHVNADYMGMLATVMNALIVKDAIEAKGGKCKIQTSIPIGVIGEVFDHEKAIELLESGTIVIFAGGTGHPYFTTDTTAVLRGLEVDADVVVKATKVNGIYSDDPNKNPNAERYAEITYSRAILENLKIMDSTAFALCKDNDLPIIVFNFTNQDTLFKVLKGPSEFGTIVSE